MEIAKEIINALSSIPNIYVASIGILSGAIIRIIEKRKLRKTGKLKD